MGVILSGVKGSSSGFHCSIALVLFSPGQINIVISSGIKVLEFFSPMGQVVQGASNFFRNDAYLNDCSILDKGIINRESFGGIVSSVGHNNRISSDICLNN